MEIRGGKRFRTKTERRQIVEETLKAGISVSQAHDVNTNQVFYWRRQYRAGWFDEVAKKATALVPVQVVRSRQQCDGKKSTSYRAWKEKLPFSRIQRGRRIRGVDVHLDRNRQTQRP
jgi:transposase-like protein